jgi:U3 small nucleolar RNA-associated protein 14
MRQKFVYRLVSLDIPSFAPLQDEAFNSDDERMYGDAVPLEGATYDDEGEEDDEEEGDENGHAGMLAMIANLDGDSGSTKNERERSKLSLSSEAGLKTSGLTMDSLVSSLRKTSNYSTLKKQLSNLEEGKSLLQQPTPTVVEKRAARKTAYGETNEDVTKWQPAVKANRESETFNFAEQYAPKISVSHAALSSKFEPTTSMETSIQSILERSGMDEKTVVKGEFSELKANEMTADQIKKRHGELAKLRSLMFYEEQKSKRLKKIKSKMYRRIRNRQTKKKSILAQEEMKEQDPEYAAELELKAQEKRAEERMTLKHKNNSRWMKHALAQRGQGAREGAKNAIQEQLDIGRKLLEKIDRVSGNASSSEY